MVRFILILIAGFIIIDCKFPQDNMTFFKQDDGKTVNLAIDDEFLISLEANPNTGFTWSVSKIDSLFVKQVGEIDFKSGSDRFGAPGIQTFTFKCIHSGNTSLEMIYHRPWDTETAPADTFLLALYITE